MGSWSVGSWSVHHKWLMVVLGLAFALRLGAAVSVQHLLDHRLHRMFLIPGDAEGYWELGRKLATGAPYALYDPPRRVLRTPGFPLVLAAGMSVFGANYLALRCLLAGIGALACVLVYWLGCALQDRESALVAASLAAISPAQIGMSVLFLSDTCFAVALLAAVLCLAKLVVRDEFTVPGSAKRFRLLALLAGLLNGVACLFRPSWLLFVPLFLCVWIARGRTRVLAECGFMLLGLALALAPWTYRNYQVTGHFVLTSLWLGPSLYDGLQPGATGESDMRFVEQDGLYARLSEYEVDQHYRRAAWTIAWSDPGRVLRLAAIKIWRFWKPWPSAPQLNQPLFQGVVAVYSVVILLCAAAGSLLPVSGPSGTHPSRFWRNLLSAGPILYLAALHTVFVGSLRYRLPPEFALLVLSGIGLRQLWAWPPNRSLALAAS